MDRIADDAVSSSVALTDVPEFRPSSQTSHLYVSGVYFPESVRAGHTSPRGLKNILVMSVEDSISSPSHDYVRPDVDVSTIITNSSSRSASGFSSPWKESLAPCLSPATHR